MTAASWRAGDGDVVLKLGGVALFWGGTFVSARLLLADKALGPSSVACLRFVLASLLLLAMTWRHADGWPRLPRRTWVQLALLGFAGISAYHICFMRGLRTVEAHRASAIIAINPLLISLAAALWLGERLRARQVAGIVLAMVGAMVVIADGSPAFLFTQRLGSGELWLCGCLLSWVVYSIGGKVLLGSLSPLVAVTFSSIAATLGLLPFALAEGVHRRLLGIAWSSWLHLVFLAVCGSVLAFLWYYQAVQRLGATRASLCIPVVPVCASLLGWAVLGEPISSSFVAGLLLIIVGLLQHRLVK